MVYNKLDGDSNASESHAKAHKHTWTKLEDRENVTKMNKSLEKKQKMAKSMRPVEKYMEKRASARAKGGHVQYKDGAK